MRRQIDKRLDDNNLKLRVALQNSTKGTRIGTRIVRAAGGEGSEFAYEITCRVATLEYLNLANHQKLHQKFAAQRHTEG
jgi:hypothetical protein